MLGNTRFYSQAVKEIVYEFRLNPDIFLSKAAYQVLTTLGDCKQAVKDLQIALNNQDFEWLELDANIQKCLKKSIYPECYPFIEEYIENTPITTVEDLLFFYSVAEIKNLIKNKKLKVKLSGKRADLVREIIENTNIEDFRDELDNINNPKLPENKASLQEKCALIISAIDSRASSLRQIHQRRSDIGVGIKATKIRLCMDDDDKILARALLGKQPKPSEFSLPPYFIGDSSFLIFD
jgi:hypothetical protein